MKYTASVLTAVVATVATAAAFAPSTPGAFVSVAGQTSSSASSTCGAQHTSSCPCASCRARVPMLFMSEVTAEETEVPPEVEAMDGVADSEEAHNSDRPARGSGIAKHKRSGGGGGGRSGTPLPPPPGGGAPPPPAAATAAASSRVFPGARGVVLPEE
mmetsp:Transcript_30633/g.62544  ORF Transcript_30633/g.62544 Transcript_30633/m.62544 type:complete len:158 (-) Transcript_30633:58-531(-)